MGSKDREELVEKAWILWKRSLVAMVCIAGVFPGWSETVSAKESLTIQRMKVLTRSTSIRTPVDLKVHGISRAFGVTWLASEQGLWYQSDGNLQRPFSPAGETWINQPILAMTLAKQGLWVYAEGEGVILIDVQHAAFRFQKVASCPLAPSESVSAVINPAVGLLLVTSARQWLWTEGQTSFAASHVSLPMEGASWDGFLESPGQVWLWSGDHLVRRQWNDSKVAQVVVNVPATAGLIHTVVSDPRLGRYLVTQKGQFHLREVPQGPPELSPIAIEMGPIIAAKTDGSDRLWVATRDKLWCQQLKSGSWFPVRLEGNFDHFAESPSRWYSDGRDDIWWRNGNQWYEHRPSTGSDYFGLAGGQGQDEVVTAFAIKNHLILGLRSGRVSLLPWWSGPLTKEISTWRLGSYREPVIAAVLGTDRRLWALTPNALWRTASAETLNPTWQRMETTTMLRSGDSFQGMIVHRTELLLWSKEAVWRWHSTDRPQRLDLPAGDRPLRLLGTWPHFVWVVGRDGVWRMDPRKFEFSPIAIDGLPEFTVPDITAAESDSQGRLWLALHRAGLWLVRDGQRAIPFDLNVNRQLKGRRFERLTSLDRDEILLGQGPHLWQLNTRTRQIDDLRLSTPKEKVTTWTQYTELSGQPGLVVPDGFGICVWKGPLQPSETSEDWQVAVRSQGSKDGWRDLFNSQRASEPVFLGQSDAPLELQWNLLAEVEPWPGLWSYRLKEFHEDWTTINQPNKSLNYPQLAPGQYTFEIAKRVSAQAEPYLLSSASFAIKSSWRFQNNWPWLLIILAMPLAFLAWSWQVRLRHQAQPAHQSPGAMNLLARTARDFEVPLLGIQTELKQLSEITGEQEQPKQRQLLAKITAMVRSLYQQMSDVEEFAQIDEKGVAIFAEPVILPKIVEPVVQELQPIANQKRVRICQNWETNLPLAYADASRVRQIIHNLTQVAVALAEDEQVAIFGCHAESVVELSIQYLGRGLQLDRLDQVWHNTEAGSEKNASQTNSHRMSLALCKRLLDVLGGQLRSERLPDGRQAICFDLPVAVEEPLSKQVSRGRPSTLDWFDESEGAAWHRQPIRKAGREQPRQTVLVVDDHPVNRQILVNFLNLRDYGVLEASDGQEALSVLEEHEEIDLILLDVMMPGLSGYEVCTRIRETWAIQQLPIIFLTARHHDEDIVRGFQVGANDFLTKPVAKEVLFARVRIHLELLQIHQILERERQFLAREVEVEKLKRLQRESNLRLLQAQMNPHFIQNTLNSIAYFCIADPQKARDTLGRLSQVLRKTFQATPKGWWTLGDEITMIEAFCEIQRTRFGKRLTIRLDWPDEPDQLPVPSFLIQPLVENAIFYSVKQQSGEVLIKMDCQRNQEVILVEVSNPGRRLGMAFENLINEDHALGNIQKRLELLFNNKLRYRYEDGHHHIALHIDMTKATPGDG